MPGGREKKLGNFEKRFEKKRQQKRMGSAVGVLSSFVQQQAVFDQPSIEIASQENRSKSGIHAAASDVTQADILKPSDEEHATADEQERLEAIWTRRQLANEFYSERGREIYWSMLQRQDPSYPDSESNLLAMLMFGKTVAGVRRDSDKDKSTYDFPVSQHPEWPKEAYYHRDDKLSGSLIDNIAKHFVEEGQYDPEKNIYIPIIIVNNASVKDVIEKYVPENERKYFTYRLYQVDGEIIGVLEVDKRAMEMKNCLMSAGLIASPWEIAKLNAKLKARNERDSTSDMNIDDGVVGLDDGQPKEPVKLENIGQAEVVSEAGSRLQEALSSLPSTIKELKESDIMSKLRGIVRDEKNPNKLLAACLYNMLNALPEEAINDEITRRISLFLSFGVDFYKNNYERFSFSVYAVTHEISLLINEAMKKGINITDYEKFKKSIENDAISSFGLSSEPTATNKYRTIAAPAMAGTHAFMVAFELAKKMKIDDGKEPSIQIVGAKYFEFNKFFPKDLHNDENSLADIYHISSGPIVNPDGITPGTDINKFIRNRLLKGKDNIEKPVTIIVDVTTGLHKNLHLDDDIKKLVEAGEISIICYESYQKFGLAHTDQVQGGVVYGVCSDKSYQPGVIDEFEKNAKADQESHLDMAVASFMHEHSGEYIERIKEQHFENGALFRSFFTGTSDYMANEIHYDDMLKNLDELYFFLITENPELKMAADANFANRDSFGHYTTSLSSISAVTRVSASASDKTDTLIQIAQLYLSSKFSRGQLFDLLKGMIISQNLDSTPYAPQQEIILTGLIMTLHNLSLAPPPLKLSEEYLLSYSIKHLSNVATHVTSGRNSLQTLTESLESRLLAKGQSSSSRDEDFVNKSELKMYLRRNPSQEDAMRVLAEITNLAERKNPKSSDQFVHKAIIALHLSGLWNKPLDSKRQIKDINFNFIGRRTMCEAITVLKNNNLLTFDIVRVLVAGNRDARRVANEIIKLNAENSLNHEALIKMLPSDRRHSSMAGLLKRFSQGNVGDAIGMARDTSKRSAVNQPSPLPPVAGDPNVSTGEDKVKHGNTEKNERDVKQTSMSRRV